MNYLTDNQRHFIKELAKAVSGKSQISTVPSRPRSRELRPSSLQGITREQHEAMRTLNPGYWTAAGLRHATFVRIDFFNGRPVAFYRFSYVDPRDGSRWTRDVRWGFRGGVLQEEKQYPARVG